MVSGLAPHTLHCLQNTNTNPQVQAKPRLQCDDVDTANVGDEEPWTLSLSRSVSIRMWPPHPAGRAGTLVAEGGHNQSCGEHWTEAFPTLFKAADTSAT